MPLSLAISASILSIGRMAGDATPNVPMGADPFEDAAGDAALRQTPWRKRWRLSSIGDALESALGRAGFDRGPWLAVALGTGIASWFVLPRPGEWVAAMLSAALVATGALALWRGRDDRTRLVMAAVGVAIAVAVGMALIWARSTIVGAEPLPRPMVEYFDARVLERIEQPAEERVRLVLATRAPETDEPIRIRVNVPEAEASPELAEGAVIRLRARLMPPAPPMLPGAYNFARAAWFEGFAATGSSIGSIDVLEPAPGDDGLIAQVQRSLSAHVRGQLGGSAGSIAAAFASGDRGAISQADDDAMRDAGLTHLLSISGLHVSAVIAAAYFLAIKILALIPPIALRVRLPLVAAAIAALAGIGYTLLTGAEVPTVRSCIAALLVLGALALGREPLSMRMIAVAAVCVLLIWPESLAGPSFQMSFAAVTAIVALHGSAPVRAFLAPREESWFARTGRNTVMLLITGLVIEVALMPIVLFHFHRAGVYGAFANVLAIPLTTFVSMPLIAIALLFDLIGLGAPFWWLAGKSLDLMLAIAHWTSAQPGAVKLMPQMSCLTFALFVAGGLWLALWRGKGRLLGFAPAAIATAMLLSTPAPDILISGDGRHVGISGEGERLLMLRETRSDYARSNMTELAGMEGETVTLAEWDGADCSREFCTVVLRRNGEDTILLLARNDQIVEERALAAACERADIVVANRFLPRTCEPRWLKADRRMLRETGGLSITLENRAVDTVADWQGAHGWWRPASNN